MELSTVSVRPRRPGTVARMISTPSPPPETSSDEKEEYLVAQPQRENLSRRIARYFPVLYGLCSLFDWNTVAYDDLPHWLQDNSFITKDYRPQLASALMCIFSLIFLHTETVNIWSHLIPTFYFIGLFKEWYDQYVLLEDANLEEGFAITCFFIGATLCFAFSAVYHTFTCRSQWVLFFFLKFDYSGIILMVVGSYIPWIYYAFACAPFLRYTYYVVGLVVSLVAGVVCFMSYFDRVENRSLRAMVFLLLTLSCFSGVVHYSCQFGFQKLCLDGQLWSIFSMTMYYLGGGILYATRLPERLLPGWFNIFGHSHQLFHMLCVIGAWTHYATVMTLYERRLELTLCPTIGETRPDKYPFTV